MLISLKYLNIESKEAIRSELISRRSARQVFIVENVVKRSESVYTREKRYTKVIYCLKKKKLSIVIIKRGAAV